MRTHRFLLLAALLAAPAFPAGDAAAQQTRTVVTAGSRGMLGIMTHAITEDGVATRQRVITEVVPGAGADKAGLLPGDLILRVNGLAATQQVMNAGFEPGDTVVLRIRRDGRERDVTVVATPRTNRMHYITTDMLPVTADMLPDTVRGRMSIIMNAVRAGTDTLPLGRVFIQRSDGDSTFVYRFGNDSINGFRYQRITPLQRDSLMRYFEAPGAWSSMFPDSAFRSDAWAGVWPGMLRDSVLGSVGRSMIRFGEDGFAFGFGPDSMTFMRPTEFMASGFFAGTRAVAGAELSELNPGLAEYFGTTDGVLVLNAREGTPAARAGLAPGDVIVRANDVDVRTIADLRRAIERGPRGQPVTLDVLRRGQRIVIRMGD